MCYKAIPPREKLASRYLIDFYFFLSSCSANAVGRHIKFGEIGHEIHCPVNKDNSNENKSAPLRGIQGVMKMNVHI